jgi:hypothetical protein
MLLLGLARLESLPTTQSLSKLKTIVIEYTVETEILLIKPLFRFHNYGQQLLSN